jgi:hypothetical protein
MQTESIVALLVAERDKLNRAIEALQGTAERPILPEEKQATVVPVAVAPVAATKKKRVWTAANRKAHIERMKAYWAAKRKAARR